MGHEQPTTTTNTTTTAPTLPLTHRIVKDNVHGLGEVYRVVGLPMFAEHIRDVDGEVYNVDEPYLGDLAGWLTERAAEGWRPAIHEEHNGPIAGPRRRLGFLDAPRLTKAVVEGQPRGVLTLDALCETLDNAREIERRPYRSAEVNLARRHFNSCAAMESEAPWFKFPITKFESPDGQPLGAGAGATHVGYGVDEGAEGLRAYAVASSTNYSALYHFPSARYEGSEDKMLPDIKDDDKKDDAKKDDSKKDDAGHAEVDGNEAEALADMILQKLQGILKPLLAGAQAQAAPANMAPSSSPVVMSSAGPTTNYFANDIEAHIRELIARETASVTAKYSALLGAATTRLEAAEKKSLIEASIERAKSETRGIVRPSDFDEQVKHYAALDPNASSADSPLNIYLRVLRANSKLNPSEIHYSAPAPMAGDSDAAAAKITDDPMKATAIRKASYLYRALNESTQVSITEDQYIDKYKRMQQRQQRQQRAGYSASRN